KKKQMLFKKLAKSPYCVEKLYDYKGENFNNFLQKKKLNKKQYYYFIIQIVFIVYLLQKYGYKHCDLHYGNISILKTKQKYIQMFGLNVPTGGYLLSAIDYGEILHNKYILTPEEKKRLNDKNYNEILTVMDMLIKNDMWDYVFKEKIKVPPMHFALKNLE